SNGLGVIRDEQALSDTVETLLPIAVRNTAASDPALIALMIAVAALRRQESRGSHYRSDFPIRSAQARSSRLTFASAMTVAAELILRPAERSA
ncbi:L-aspartate oxidase, partial [Mesorhizobium sp. M0293]